MLEFVTRRYDTNSFDEALIRLVDDWVTGKFKWDTEETAKAFSPEWLMKFGYPTEDFLPDIDTETEIVNYRWFWCCGNDELIVDGHFIKSIPIGEGEWPTMGVT